MTSNNKELNYEWENLLGGKIDESLFKSDISYIESKNIFKKYVKIINLETFSYCNRYCSYCPVSLLDNKQNTYLKDSHFDLIIKNLKEINYSNTLSLNLYNEPLSDKSIYNTISNLRKALPKANLFFNSNGDYLTTNLLNKLSDTGLNSIHITLHTLPNETYSDERSLVKIEKFYNKLKIDYKINTQKENQYIRTSFKFKNLLISVETNNYDDFGESRAGSMDNLIEVKKEIGLVLDHIENLHYLVMAMLILVVKYMHHLIMTKIQWVRLICIIQYLSFIHQKSYQN